MLQAYTVNCIYAPYIYNLDAGNAVLVLPQSLANDANTICNTFIEANVGITNIEIKTTLNDKNVILYLSYKDVSENGIKIKSIYSKMKLGETSLTAYAFIEDETLEEGSISLVNSSTYKATEYTAVFSIKSDKAYTVISDSETNEEFSGKLIIKMNSTDYERIFEEEIEKSTQAVLYFENDTKAIEGIANLPDGFMGTLSTNKVYVQNVGDVYSQNVLYYIALIAVCILFAALISVIFGKSVKIYQTDFAVYRTLGISNKTSAHSLYIQLALIFIPTLVLLPIVSLISAVIPGSSMTFISIGNYLFIEIMMFLMIELVALGFNRSISGQSIRKSLRRGMKG